MFFPTWPTLTIAYEVTLPRGLAYLRSDITNAEEAALDTIAWGLVNIYQAEIEEVKAVRTGFFRDTVRVRQSARLIRWVGSLANYAAVVEHGWIYRARGQQSYPGRFPAARAIARLDTVVEDAFFHQLMR